MFYIKIILFLSFFLSFFLSLSSPVSSRQDARSNTLHSDKVVSRSINEGVGIACPRANELYCMGINDLLLWKGMRLLRTAVVEVVLQEHHRGRTSSRRQTVGLSYPGLP